MAFHDDTDAASARSGRIAYLDHAATTPLRPEALETMTAELARLGNPSSLHTEGRRARRVVEESRELIAESFGARPSEVIFTSGGTEADNLAVKGLYWARQAAAPRRRRVLTTAIEHHAVLDCVQWLADHEGAEVTWLPVDSTGLLTPEVLRQAIGPGQHGPGQDGPGQDSAGQDSAGQHGAGQHDGPHGEPDSVALISVMWANNEVGTVQPVSELAAVAREHQIAFHSDAVQAAAQLPVDFAASGADALSISGHKLGGPVGVGALLLARQAEPVPVLHGGGQERDIRSGTLDTPAISAFATAVQLTVKESANEARRLAALAADLIGQIHAAIPDAILNGPPPGPGRLPGNVHFSFPGCEGDALLMLLDAKGIACSTGSACTAGVAQPSHVLLAMEAGEARARGSLRFSLGRTSTQQDVEALAAVIGEAVDRARRAGR
jgi:cysteine sulfinate desulfinase/cysteine desulfurase-like protein